MQNIDMSGLAEIIVSLIAGAIGGLIAAASAYWFGVRRDVAKLRAELKYQRMDTRIDQRDQVLGEIWKSIQSALSKAAIATAALKQHPDFRRLSDEAAREILESSPLTQRQRKELLEAPDRTTYYRNAMFWHEIHEARGALYELNGRSLENKIYVPADLAEAILELIKTLNDGFISYEIWYETKDRELMKRARSEIKQSEALVADIESGMRSFIQEPDQV